VQAIEMSEQADLTETMQNSSAKPAGAFWRFSEAPMMDGRNCFGKAFSCNSLRSNGNFMQLVMQ
jgi:hypothetical protein